MKIEPCEQYNCTIEEVVKNRDCIEGGARVKSKTTVYLKHPGIADMSKTGEAAYYRVYIDGAEFIDYPMETEASLVGKLDCADTEFQIPAELEYLLDNADGDGMPLTGLIEFTAKNILAAKFHILLAELPGTVGLDVKNLSRAQAEKLNLKAAIKHYCRESLIDWQFDKYDGKYQLTLAIFREIEHERDPISYAVTKETHYLILGLDETGYFQQKYKESDKGELSELSVKIYPSIGGANLKWIPIEIISDEEIPAGTIPRSAGYLSPICSLALARYRVSADYKENLRNGTPTLFSKGWTTGDGELFKELNGGREQVVTGSRVVNILPNNATVEVAGVAMNDQPYVNYFEANSQHARALGAKFSDGSEKFNTATDATINSGNNNAVLEKTSSNLEAGFERVVLYCGMFNGLFGQDKIEENLKDIEIKMPREFSAITMTADDARAVRDLYKDGLMSLETAITKLVNGGFTPISAEEELSRVEAAGPTPNDIAAQKAADAAATQQPVPGAKPTGAPDASKKPPAI